MVNNISLDHKTDLFWISDFLYIAFFIFTHKQTVITVHTHAQWILQTTVINVTEKLSICVKDMDTMVIAIGSQDTTLTVCCDTIGFKWFGLGRWGMTSVSKSEFPSLINHHYSTSSTVSHADIQVLFLLMYLIYLFPEYRGWLSSSNCMNDFPM